MTARRTTYGVRRSSQPVLRALLAALVFGTLLGAPREAHAHPAPWSYLDVVIDGATVDFRLTVHVFDLAHDLGLPDAPALLDPATLAAQTAASIALVSGRLTLEIDGRIVTGDWTAPVPSGEGDSVRFTARFKSRAPVSRVVVRARLFPYDALHQTFVNFYETGALRSQAVLDSGRTDCRFTTGVEPRAWAVVREFVPTGIHHILIGPDHLLFLIGLLLLGGSWRRLVLVVTAFTVAHSITLSVAALGWIEPPTRIIEPAIALSIVYVGIDNLLVRGGRDARTWIAFAFGLIHGFGFANVLREMALPRGALLWSLGSFNVGVEIGQLAVVLVVAALLAAIRRQSARLGRHIAVAGSVMVILAGGYWFVERVFWPS